MELKEVKKQIKSLKKSLDNLKLREGIVNGIIAEMTTCKDVTVLYQDSDGWVVVSDRRYGYAPYNMPLDAFVNLYQKQGILTEEDFSSISI